MTEDPKKRFRKAVEDIDLNLSGLINTVGQALNEAVNRLDQSGKGQSDHGFETTKGPVRAHAGVRVRMGGLDTGATSNPKPVNPNRARSTGDQPMPKRELHYDLFEDETAWILTAEVPGASLADLSLEIDGDHLLLRTTAARQYHARIPLPVRCTAPQIGAAVQNGILTLQFPKDTAQ